MAPRKESPKNKARKPHKATANRKTANKTQNKEKVRKVQPKGRMKKIPEKRESSHGYNLRARSSSVMVLEEACACSEIDRRRLHRLHLHSSQCSSLSKNTRRRQSHISVVTVSSEEDEHMTLERAARWVNSVDFERGEEEGVQGEVQRESRGELRERGRAGGGGGGSEPEPMVVDLSLLDEGIQMETDSVQLLPPKKAKSPSVQFEIACAMNLSADLAQDAFQPLCVSTPEGGIPISLRPMDVPDPSTISIGDSVALNPEAETFRFILDPARIGDSTGLPATLVNPEPEISRCVLDRYRVGDCNGLPATSVNQRSPQFIFGIPRIGKSTEHPATSVEPETSQLFFDLPRVGDSTRTPATSVNPEPETSQFLFGSARPIRQLWMSSASPLGSSGNPISYEFGMSGIKRFEPVNSEQDLKVDGERKRKRSRHQVASSSTSPVPSVLYEKDN